MSAHAATYQHVTDLILAEQPFLQGLAMRLARRTADADDLVQETLLRAYNARDRFRAGTSMRAWLATILRRLFLTAAIKSKRRATRTDTDSGDVIHLSGATSRHAPMPLSYEATLEQLDDSLKRALERLPQTYREPLVLFAFEGQPYVEIAAQLRIPVGTVMSRIHRGRQRMKRALSETAGAGSQQPALVGA